MRRLILAFALLTLAPLAHAGGPVATGFSGRGSETNSRGVYPAGETRAVIDLTPMFAPAINDRYDQDGSMYGYSDLPRVGNSTGDFIDTASVDTSSSMGASGCGTSQCEMAFPSASTVNTNVLTLPAAWRFMLCRDNTGAPYTPCGGNSATCVTAGTLGVTHPFPIVIHHAGIDEYVPYGVTTIGATACQETGAFDVTVVPRLARAITTADGLAPLYRDIIHYSAYGAKALGNFIANATWDSIYIPKTYDIPGMASGVGTMETDCTTGSNWSATSGTTLSSTTPGTSDYTNHNTRLAVWGKGCKMLKNSSGNLAATDYITNAAITTVVGTTYTARFFSKSTANSDGNGITADVLVSGSGNPEASVYDFFFGPTPEETSTGGWHSIAHATGVGCQVPGRNGLWNLCAMKFVATSTATKLRFGVSVVGAGTTTSLWVDEVYMFKSANPIVSEMTPLFDIGNVSVTFDGDSQVWSGLGNLGGGFAWAMGKKANTRLVCPPSLCMGGTPGATLANLLNMKPPDPDRYGYQRYRTMRPGIALFNTMVNDLPAASWTVGTPQTLDVAKTQAYMEAVFKTVGAYAGLPIWLTTQPWGYAQGTNTVGCASGWQCSMLGNQIVTAILHDQN